MRYDSSWILCGLERDEEELGRAYVKGCGMDGEGRFLDR